MTHGLSSEDTPEGKPPFIFPSNVSMLDAALIYARYGWPVFPVQPQNKRPYPNTHGFYDATLDLERIERWWRRNPDSMIATATGALSGIFAVDLDRKEAHEDGVATWALLTAKNGGMPLTLSSTTPSAGQHHIFRHRDGLRGVKLDGIAPGIEIKADGGYIVLAPSLYTATNGGAGVSYRWNTPLLPVAEPPEWLVAEIRKHNERGPQTGDQEPTSSDPSVPYERVKAALSVINPDIDRQSWFNIGCALFTQLGSEGFELWNGWSSKGKKYQKHEMGSQWDSIVKGRYAYTVGTLFYHANHAQPDWREAEPNQPGHVDDGGQHERQNLIQTSGDFVANFVPPDYQIDGLLQRGFIYAITAPSSSGKTCIAMRLAAHVGLGLKLGNREVEQGKVLYLAGENPNDCRMRWIKLCEELGKDPKDVPVFFLPGNPQLSRVRKQIDTETLLHGPFALVVIDTSAAYFEGDNENDNVQMGKHARMLRSLAKLPGGPTIIVTCHPTKNADPDNYVPRGGVAFLNEIDANLICKREPNSMAVQLHWQRKIRGVDFAPIPFQLRQWTTESLKDSKGRLIWTVTARPISEDEQTDLDERVHSDEDRVLRLMQEQPGLSMAKIAETLNWTYTNGEANKSKVDRTIRALAKLKLVSQNYRGNWALTKKGEEAAASAKAAEKAAEMI